MQSREVLAGAQGRRLHLQTKEEWQPRCCNLVARGLGTELSCRPAHGRAQVELHRPSRMPCQCIAATRGACVQAWLQKMRRPEQSLHAQPFSLCLLTDNSCTTLQAGTLLQQCCSPPAWGCQHAWRCLSLARWEWSHRCCHPSPACQTACDSYGLPSCGTVDSMQLSV